MIKQLLGAVVAVGMLATTSSAVELKMKYEPGVTRTMNVEMNLKGDLDVGGDTPVKGTAQGKILTEMDLKVQSVDDEGVGTIEQSISNIDMEFSAEAETPDGPKKWDVDLSPEHLGDRRDRPSHGDGDRIVDRGRQIAFFRVAFRR